MNHIKIKVPTYVKRNGTKWTDGEYLLMNTILEFTRLSCSDKVYYGIHAADFRKILHQQFNKKATDPMSSAVLNKLREVFDIRIINEYNIEIRLKNVLFYKTTKTNVEITDPAVINRYHYLQGRLISNVFNDNSELMFHDCDSKSAVSIYKKLFKVHA